MWRVTIKGILAHKLRLALTALAIVLGVTFVTGTLVLTDTLHSTFTNLFGNVYQHVDFEVRGKAVFSESHGGGAARPQISESLLTTVRSVPGVADAQGSVSGYAQFVAPDGKAVTTNGAPTIGTVVQPLAADGFAAHRPGPRAQDADRSRDGRGHRPEVPLRSGRAGADSPCRVPPGPSPSPASCASARPIIWPAPPSPHSRCRPRRASSMRSAN